MDPVANPPLSGGDHWLVEVRGARPESLAGAAGRRALEGLFADLVRELRLTPIGAPLWHTFDGPPGPPGTPGARGAPGTGGTTALLALTESHLAAHGFPEAGVLCLDLFTCRPRGTPAWDALIERHFGAAEVDARVVARGGALALPSRTDHHGDGSARG